LLPVAEACRRAGHETLFVGPRSLAATFERHGLAHRLGADPSPSDAARVWGLFPTLPRDEAAALVEKEWFATLCADALTAGMAAAFDEFSPQLVIREACEYASAALAVGRGIPQAQVGVSTAEAEALVLTGLVRTELERTSPGLVELLWRSPYLSKFPPSMESSPYPRTVRYRPDPAPAGPRLPEWWAHPERPLVYVTLGTVAPSMAGGPELLARLVATIAELEVRVLVTTGGDANATRACAARDNVHVEAWLDQGRVLGEAAVVVAHGGTGTTLGALAAGVPMVVLPLFADQHRNAGAVERCGAGRAVGARSRVPAENFAWSERLEGQVRAAVRDVLRDDRFASAARTVADEMAALEPLDRVVADLVVPGADVVATRAVPTDRSPGADALTPSDEPGT
jgi:UDP:flavonoid glycosyltransferase YjiC (YdhE family)